MIDDWLYTTLSECAKWYSGGTPRTSILEYWNGDIPWISASSMHDFYICDSERRVTPLGVENGTRLVPENTVLFVVRGMSLKTEFRVGISRCPVTFGQDCKALIAKPSIDPLFLAYFLRSQSPEILGLVDEASHGTGRLPTEVLQEIEVPLPPLPEQKAIAQVLSSLDDKIDLLHRQNKTLEAIAETLFRQWFIEDPKNDWEEEPLSTIATFLNGLACQKFPPQNESEKLPVLKIRELKSGISDDCDYATTNVKPEYVIEAGDVIFAWSASLIVKIWDGQKCILNQHLFKVTSEDFPKWFYYRWCKFHLDEFIAISRAQATTMGHIKRGDLDIAMVTIPSQQELDEMSKVLSPNLEKIENNNRQIRVLKNLRDALLPKLMSGEVRVAVDPDQKAA